MALVLFDSNILIDNFNGHAAAVNELSAYADAIISSIVWIEVACLMDQDERDAFDALLLNAGIRVVHPNDDIMRRAATIRGDSVTNQRIGTGKKLNLADCIIRATAEAEGRIIVTRNPVDFGGEGPTVHVPYELVNNVAIHIKPAL